MKGEDALLISAIWLFALDHIIAGIISCVLLGICWLYNEAKEK